MPKQPLLETVPVDVHHLIPGMLKVEVHGKPYDFRLPNLDDEVLSVEERTVLCGILERRGIETLFVPRLDECNATFGYGGAFDIKIELPEVGVTVQKSSTSVDALQLPRKTGCLIRSADCPTIVLWDESKKVVRVGHCSRDSLVDRELLLCGRLWRQSTSVITSMMERFKHLTPGDIRGHIACGILPEHFEHRFDDAIHGKYNRELIHSIQRLFPACLKSAPEEGCIDLAELVRQQLRVWFKIPRGNIGIDDLDTFSHPRLHSHRGGDTGRNGIFVFHT